MSAPPGPAVPTAPAASGAKLAPKPTGFPLVDRILDGTAPAAARAAAARGALPVPREALLVVLVHLARDQDTSIRASARSTLDGIGLDELAVILASEETDPTVLAFYAASKRLSADALVGLIANPALQEETIVEIASMGSAGAIDTLLMNQERLARTPAALSALSGNPKLTPDQKRRLLDFTEHLELPAERQPEAEPSAPTEALDPEFLGPVSEEELRSLLGELGELPFIDLEVGDLLKEGEAIEWDEAFDEAGAAFETVYNQIMRMNPAQRLRAALRGGREARQILIRDKTRAVASAVLRNPKLSEEEVTSFASQKSLSDIILRQIGSSRAWMGSYTIILNLVKNPKTPLSVAMNHMSRLNTKDLGLIGRDRGVSEVIARAARRQVELRQPARRGSKRH